MYQYAVSGNDPNNKVRPSVNDLGKSLCARKVRNKLVHENLIVVFVIAQPKYNYHFHIIFSVLEVFLLLPNHNRHRPKQQSIKVLHRLADVLYIIFP